MKKFVIAFCTAALLGASALASAGDVTLVNKYNQPVTFAVSHGSLYNPVVIGTVASGERGTVSMSGPFTPDFIFMAFPPHQSMIVTNCGSPDRMMNDVVVKAGWSKETGMFACRVYEKKPCKHQHHQTLQRHHHHHHYCKMGK